MARDGARTKVTHEVEVNWGDLTHETLTGLRDNYEQVRAAVVRTGMDQVVVNLKEMFGVPEAVEYLVGSRRFSEHSQTNRVGRIYLTTQDWRNLKTGPGRGMVLFLWFKPRFICQHGQIALE